MTEDSLTKTGIGIGRKLFEKTCDELADDMTKHGHAGGNPRDVALGFFLAYAGWFSGYIGFHSMQALLKDVSDTIKRVAH